MFLMANIVSKFKKFLNCFYLANIFLASNTDLLLLKINDNSKGNILCHF
jgi:hypothetical protein